MYSLKALRFISDNWTFGLLCLFLASTGNSASAIMTNGIRGSSQTDFTTHLDSTNSLKIETISGNLTGKSGDIIHFRVKNEGAEDEYVRVNISDEHGFVRELPEPKEFMLPSGSSQEISVRMNYDSSNILNVGPDLVTVQATGRRNKVTVKRSPYYPGEEYDSQYGQQTAPFCYDRYVTGTCRYRTAPEYCFQYEWTAYAIVQTFGGQILRSIPEGLFVPGGVPGPGTQDRVRVWVKTSCCTPLVQIISSDPRVPFGGNSCIVDVRELQWLHPGEIAGIAAGVALLVILIIVIVVVIIRRRRAQTVLVGHGHGISRGECVSRQ